MADISIGQPNHLNQFKNISDKVSKPLTKIVSDSVIDASELSQLKALKKQGLSKDETALVDSLLSKTDGNKIEIKLSHDKEPQSITFNLKDKNDNRVTKTDVLHKNITGAYFDKVETNPAKENIGLSGEATLPTVNFDPDRNDPNFGRLDIPSVYMGGHAGEENVPGKELDAGLSWDKVYDDNGNQTFTDDVNGTDGGNPEKKYTPLKDSTKTIIGYNDGNGKLVAGTDTKGNKAEKDLKSFAETLKPNYAFRPFWRTTNSDTEQLSKTDEKQKVDFKDNKIKVNGKEFAVTEKNGKLTYTDGNNKQHPLLKDGDNYYIAKDKWHNPNTVNSKNPVDGKNVYFYPGQKIKMNIKSGKDGNISLEINSADKKTNFKEGFYAEGFGKNEKQSFKAVNSIDQFMMKDGKRVGLEGLEVLPTKTQLTNASWSLKSISDVKGKIKYEEVNDKNSKEYRGSDTLPEDFKRSKTGNTRTIDIDPNESAHNKINYIVNRTSETVKNEVSPEIKKLLSDPKILKSATTLNNEIENLKNAKPLPQKKIEEKQNQLRETLGVNDNIMKKFDYLKSYFSDNDIKATVEELNRCRSALNKAVNEAIRLEFVKP